MQRKPWMAGTLLEPGGETGRYMSIRFSPIDEHLYEAGAEPEKAFSEQLREGPFSWIMFLSSVGFCVPAFIHLSVGKHLADFLAGASLLLVSISSSLCDAFCVWSGIFDDGSEAEDFSKYEKTGIAIGRSPAWVAVQIQQTGAEPQIYAPDRWNNVTRLFDRFVCIAFVLPSVVFYLYKERPFFYDTVVFCIVFAIAWISCVVGQRFRAQHVCGVKRDEGGIIIEEGYRIFMAWHELWHFLLIILLIASALYRPDK